MNAEIIEFLYRRHYKYLFMVAYRICERWDLAEDILQDGFIKILTSKEQFLNWQLARQYLCGCIRNAAFERLNKETRQRAIRRDFVEPNMSTVEEVAINLYKLKSAITRTILDEIYFHNRTQRQIAKEYKISRNRIAEVEKNGLKELFCILSMK